MVTNKIKTTITATLLFVIALPVKAEQIRIAVAANFYSTLNDIKKEFEKKNNGKITIIKGSTGKLYAQIKHGAPYDIFMAADAARPELLEQQGLTVKNSRYTYAKGELVLWSASNTIKQDSDVLVLLKKGNFKKLAMANPKTAPYGLAAKQTLEKMKLTAITKNKIVYAENIAQAYQFIQSGSAELGFVAHSYVKPVSKNYWHVPTDFYQPLEQQMVILKRTKSLELATRFQGFLKTPEIMSLIKQQGYIL